MAAIATLTVRLNAQIAEFQSEFKAATKSAQKFADDFEGTATKAAAVGAFFGTIAADIAKSIASGLASALKDAVKFSSEFNNAFIGLGSVARAFGTDTDLATAAARRLSADGLLPLKDSATGLKNLLAAGFNLEQSTKLMDAFKDSAAFGRQGALSFGDAVRSATEGVKNGNSILVDNAGVTKNLSQILKEAGFSAQDLSRASSDVGVRMALFSGILKETAAQTGDAAKLTQTYTGQVTRLDSQYTQLLASIGDSITQNKNVAQAIGFVGDAVQDLTKWLGENNNGFNLVSDAVIFTAKTFAAFTTAIDVVHGGLNTLDTAVRTSVKALADSVVGLSKMLLSIATLASKLPGGTAAIGLYADEIVSLAIVSGQAETTSKDMAAQIKANGDSTKSWSEKLGTARASINDLVDKMERARGESVKFGGSQGVAADRTNAAANAADRHGDALARLTALTPEQVQVQNLWVKAKEHEKAAVDFAAQSWKAWEQTVSTALKNVTANSAPLLLITRNMSGIVPQVNAGGAGNLAGKTPSPAAGGGLFATMFGSSEQFGQQLSQAILGAIQGGGSIVGAASGAIGSSIGSNIAGMLKKDGTKMFTGALGGIFSAALPVVGSLIGPLAEAIMGKLFGTSGRDTKLDMAKQAFGSVENMQKLMLTLGDDYHRLWKQFSEVGQNNKGQAVAAIDAITEALAKQKTKTDEVAAASTAAAAAQQTALDGIAAKYNDTIDGLKSELGSFSASLQAEQDAPEFDEIGNRIYGVLESQQMARQEILAKQIKDAETLRDIEIAAKKQTFDEMLLDGADVDARLRTIFGQPLDIPYRFVLQGSAPGGSGSPAAPASSVSGGGAGAVHVTVVSQLDGREVARNQVQYLGGHL